VHKYEMLEKLYYRKKFVKFLIIFVILILILLILKMTFFNRKNNKGFNNKNNVSNNIKSKSEKNISKNNIKNIKIKKEINKSDCVLKIKTENNLTDDMPQINFILPKIKINDSIDNTKKENNKSNNQKKLKSEVKIKVKQEPLIIEENVNVNSLIKNFKNNPSFDTAIQISQYYLNKNKFDLAKLWALKANSINPEKYESWKIFAIILLKKNKKEKAKEVLQTYLNDYGQNEDIQTLLRSINE
jgi:lipopolysaccharide export LptBFGC system permease protein LptF